MTDIETMRDDLVAAEAHLADLLLRDDYCMVNGAYVRAFSALLALRRALTEAELRAAESDPAYRRVRELQACERAARIATAHNPEMETP